MIYDPVTTFAIYMIAILAVFTLCAIVADLWLAHDQRKERRARRDQARATRRAKLREERESFHVDWLQH